MSNTAKTTDLLMAYNPDFVGYSNTSVSNIPVNNYLNREQHTADGFYDDFVTNLNLLVARHPILLNTKTGGNNQYIAFFDNDTRDYAETKHIQLDDMHPADMHSADMHSDDMRSDDMHSADMHSADMHPTQHKSARNNKSDTDLNIFNDHVSYECKACRRGKKCRKHRGYMDESLQETGLVKSISSTTESITGGESSTDDSLSIFDNIVNTN